MPAASAMPSISAVAVSRRTRIAGAPVAASRFAASASSATAPAATPTPAASALASGGGSGSAKLVRATA